jgi:hypothetical protein
LSKKEKAYTKFYNLLKKRDKKSYNEFIHFLEIKDVTVHEFHLLSFMKTLNIDAYRNYRKSNAINPFSDKITDTRKIEDQISCLITIYNIKEETINHYAEQFLDNQVDWIAFKRKEFVDLGIIIEIYERKIIDYAER